MAGDAVTGADVMPAPRRSNLPSAVGIVSLFALGATVGSFFDGFHTHAGTTSYPHPIAWRMAWWTPPLFGGAFTLLGLSYAAALARRTGSRPRYGWATRLGALAAFGALYFASGFLPASNVVKLGVLAAGGAGLVAWLDPSAACVVVGLAAALAGPAFEVLLVNAGAFSHLQPDVLGIPMWLPALYFASVPGVGPTAVALVRVRRGVD